MLYIFHDVSNIDFSLQDPVLKHGWRSGAIVPELEVICNFEIVIPYTTQ